MTFSADSPKFYLGFTKYHKRTINCFCINCYLTIGNCLKNSTTKSRKNCHFFSFQNNDFLQRVDHHSKKNLSIQFYTKASSTECSDHSLENYDLDSFFSKLAVFLLGVIKRSDV